jgi:hypothetical protein
MFMDVYNRQIYWGRNQKKVVGGLDAPTFSRSDDQNEISKPVSSSGSDDDASID